MKDPRSYLIPALILIILLFWFDRGNNRSELKKADKIFKDSISSLVKIKEVQEIEIINTRDTVSQLKARLKALQLTTAQSKAVKVKVLSEPKIIVPDTILQAYEVVRERLEQDENRLYALHRYANDLENEVVEANKVIKGQEREIKALNAMNETKDLMIAQLDARHLNDQELFKNERKLKRKWIVVGVAEAILIVLVAL